VTELIWRPRVRPDLPPKIFSSDAVEAKGRIFLPQNHCNCDETIWSRWHQTKPERYDEKGPIGLEMISAQASL